MRCLGAVLLSMGVFSWDECRRQLAPHDAILSEPVMTLAGRIHDKNRGGQRDRLVLMLDDTPSLLQLGRYA